MPISDSEGHIYHHVLAQNSEYFISISEDKYLPGVIKREYPNDVRPTMVFTIALESEDTLRRAFDLLSKNGNPCNGLTVEPGTVLYGDVFDQFGVFWCLYVPQDWGAFFVP